MTSLFTVMAVLASLPGGDRSDWQVIESKVIDLNKIRIGSGYLTPSWKEVAFVEFPKLVINNMADTLEAVLAAKPTNAQAKIQIYSTEEKRTVFETTVESSHLFGRLVFSKDGTRLAATTFPGLDRAPVVTLRIDRRTGKHESTPCSHALWQYVFFDKDDRLISIREKEKGASQGLEVVDLDSGKRICSIVSDWRGDYMMFCDPYFVSPCRNQIVFAPRFGPKALVIHDLATGEEIAGVPKMEMRRRAVCLDDSRDLLAVISGQSDRQPELVAVTPKGQVLHRVLLSKVSESVASNSSTGIGGLLAGGKIVLIDADQIYAFDWESERVIYKTGPGCRLLDVKSEASSFAFTRRRLPSGLRSVEAKEDQPLPPNTPHDLIVCQLKDTAVSEKLK